MLALSVAAAMRSEILLVFFGNDGVGESVLPILNLLINESVQLLLKRLPNLLLLRWLALSIPRVNVFIHL